jgi:hypothetical protein
MIFYLEDDYVLAPVDKVVAICPVLQPAFITFPDG